MNASKKRHEGGEEFSAGEDYGFNMTLCKYLKDSHHLNKNNANDPIFFNIG